MKSRLYQHMMRFVVKISSIFIFCLLLVGASHASLINIPTLPGNPPVINGVLSPGEWQGASAAPVCLSAGLEVLDPSGRFYVAHSGNNLYFAFITDSMKRMPVSKATEHDGEVWEDDSIELYLRIGGVMYQLIVNADGTVFDKKGADSNWTTPGKVAASKIGTEFAVGYAGGEEVKRGFAVELMLSLDLMGIAIPSANEEWGLQVALNMLGSNPHATWTPLSALGITSSIGTLVWGGLPNQLEGISVEEDGRCIRLNADFGEYAGCAIPSSNGAPTNLLWISRVKEPIILGAGSKYLLDIKGGNHFSFAFNVTAQMKIPVVAVPVPSKQSYYIACDPGKLQNTIRKPLSMSLVRDNETLWTGYIDVPQLKTKKIIYVSYKGWKPGSIQLIVKEVQPDGNLVEAGRIPLNVPSYTPEWMSYTLPKLPVVPEPFEQVQANVNRTRVWGRVYSVGKSPFLDQASSLGAEMLASPITLRGKVDGIPIDWKMQSWRLVSFTRDKAVYSAVASSANLELTVKTTIEYDGMIRFDWQLTPTKGSSVVSELMFVVPVKRAVARSFMQYSLQRYSFNEQSTWNRSGDLSDAGWACEFTPFFWLGDQTRGMQWFAEHRAGWTPADEKRIIEVKCSQQAAELTLHIADTERIIDKPLSFTFGLIASPMKKRPSACDMSGNRTMALSEIKQLTAVSPVRSAVQIPRGPEHLFEGGCMEVDFRVDWNPEKPTEQEKSIDLLAYGNVSLRWIADKKILRVVHQTTELGEVVIGETPVSLVKGTWYRLAWNYGKQNEVFLDGKLLLSAPDSNSMPAFDWWLMNRIGGSGRISLRRWRVSYVPRTVAQFQPSSEWMSDIVTVHMELLENDPTPMNLTNSVSGYPYSPGYLAGNWSYDAKQRCLVAGADMPPETSAKQLSRMGVRGALIYMWSKNILGNDGARDPQQFTKDLEICNQSSIRVTPYTVWGITNQSQELEDYKWELSMRAPEEEIPASWRETGQVCYAVSPVGIGARRNLYYIDQMMRQGCGGVYLDGAIYPDDCTNPLSGYNPVIDPVTNKAVMVHHIFDRREYMKTMYGLVKYYRKDGIIDAHASGGYDLPIMSFVTDATNGESLGTSADWRKSCDLPVIRAEFHARQYGFNSDSLFYNNSPVPMEYGIALMGIHGQTPRCMWGIYPDRVAGIWKLVDRFDTKSAQWMPYYNPEKSAFKPGTAQTIASAFVLPGQRTLLLVANWSDEPRTDTIRIDWKKLGMTAKAPVKICNWNMPVTVKNGSISLSFKPRQLLYVWIGDDTLTSQKK